MSERTVGQSVFSWRFLASHWRLLFASNSDVLRLSGATVVAAGSGTDRSPEALPPEMTAELAAAERRIALFHRLVSLWFIMCLNLVPLVWAIRVVADGVRRHESTDYAVLNGALAFLIGMFGMACLQLVLYPAYVYILRLAFSFRPPQNRPEP